MTGRPARDLRSKTRTVPEPRLKARERGGSQKRPWQPKQRRARPEKRRFGPKECELGPEQSERGRQKISAGPPSLFSGPDSLFLGPPKSEFAREKCWRAPREIFWECAGNCWHNLLDPLGTTRILFGDGYGNARLSNRQAPRTGDSLVPIPNSAVRPPARRLARTHERATARKARRLQEVIVQRGSRSFPRQRGKTSLKSR